MFTFLKERRMRKKGQRLALALALLSSACAQVSKQVKLPVQSRPSQTVPVILLSEHEVYLLEIFFQEDKEVLRKYLTDPMKARELKKLVDSIRSNKANSRKFDEFTTLLQSAAEHDDLQYFYDGLGAGNIVLAKFREYLDAELVFHHQLTSLEKLGFTGYVQEARKNAQSRDSLACEYLKDFITKFVYTIIDSTNKGSADRLKILKEIRLFLRKFYALLEKSELAMPKTQAYLQDITIELGGEIEAIESKQ